MKKLCLIGAFLFSLFAVQNAYSQNACSYPPSDCNSCEGEATGECYCLYVRYQPCYYTTKRCVEEQIPCTRRCCRYVPKYYEVQRCRYVPQYYTETVCRNEPEYYQVEEFKTCKKTICEPQCRYVPKYYWKYNCAPTTNSCAPCGQ